MTRRARHFLMAKVALDTIAAKGQLPKSSSVAIAAGVHPSTARRWLADLREVLPRKASALRRTA